MQPSPYCAASDGKRAASVASSAIGSAGKRREAVARPGARELELVVGALRRRRGSGSQKTGVRPSASIRRAALALL